MRRVIALSAVLALLPLTWVRTPIPALRDTFELGFAPVALPSPDRMAAHLGPFHLERIWELRSRTRRFGSYSALLIRPGGEFLALSDSGNYLRFRAPGEPQVNSGIGELPLSDDDSKSSRDVESATQDASGTIWLGLEGRNAIFRMTPGLDVADLHVERRVSPPSMRDWGVNTGPEAMTRLADGRFVLLREGFAGWSDRLHPAVVFAGDPTENARVQQFTFDGPAGFSPTDMVQLPDGRLLVLMRRLIWPMPQRFSGRIAIGDPKAIRAGQPWRVTEVAQLSSDLPVDNFEGLAVVPRADGQLTVWVISDDNYSPLQRTLLWKMRVDPADLP